MTSIHKLLLLCTAVAACAHQLTPSLPAPTALLYCYQLTAGRWSTSYGQTAPVLPSAINLGNTQGGRSPLQVGTLIPNASQMRALWRLAPPDSLLVDLVPGGGVWLNGIRLNMRINGDSLMGEARMWSDEVGAQPTAPIIGRRVRCPAGA